MTEDREIRIRNWCIDEAYDASARVPDILEAVGRRIPMPNYMTEQMPDLMSKTRDNLL